jgi:hypothetical protein
VIPKQSTDLWSNFSQPIPVRLLVLESTNDDPVIKSSVKGVGAVTTGTKTTANAQNPRLNQTATNDLEPQNTLERAQSNNSMSICRLLGNRAQRLQMTPMLCLCIPFGSSTLEGQAYTPYTLLLHKIGKIGVIRSLRV